MKLGSGSTSSCSNRGPSVCPDCLPLPMEAADTAVLTKFADTLLDPEIVERAIADALGELRPAPMWSTPGAPRFRRSCAGLKDERQRYVDSVAKGREIGVLVKALRERDQRCLDLQRELASLDGVRRVSASDVQKIERLMRPKLADWRQMLRRHAPLAQQILMRRIDGRLTFTPDVAQRIYTFTGTATLRNLLRGLVPADGKQAVPQVWRARRDSNPRPTGSKPVALSS